MLLVMVRVLIVVWAGRQAKGLGPLSVGSFHGALGSCNVVNVSVADSFLQFWAGRIFCCSGGEDSGIPVSVFWLDLLMLFALLELESSSERQFGEECFVKLLS